MIGMNVLHPPRRATADSDRLGRIAELITGQPAGGFFAKDFYEVGALDGWRAGEALVVTLDDPLSIRSDTHTVALIWDDKLLEQKTRMDEGTSRPFVISTVKGTRLSVWIDTDNVPVNVSSRMPASQAVDAAKEAEKDGFDALVDAAEKEKLRQERLIGNVLFGVGVVVVVGLIAAAYAIANTKMQLPGPQLKVG